jgi:hypothetical protein
MRGLGAIPLAVFVVVVSACGGGNSGSSPTQAEQGAANLIQRHSVDTRCDLAAYPSADWLQCELENHARTLEANVEQLAPSFVIRSQTQENANRLAMLARIAEDPSWSLPPTQGTTPVTPLCSAGMGPCVGDPFRYPGVDGPDGRTFYEQEAVVEPVVYYDEGCARISGRVWRPRALQAGERAPVVVIKNGSVQAGEQLYWWAAQALVRAGYVVLTSDPRGQGASDMATPNSAEQGGNINGHVFYQGLVNDIDFILSRPALHYPHEASCAGSYPTETRAFNPFHAFVDRERIGIAGHSYGAAGVTWVQAYGAPGAENWPGLLSAENPVDAVVAWDALGYTDTGNNATITSVQLPPGTTNAVTDAFGGSDFPAVVAHKPALSFKSEYGFTPVPFVTDPDRDAHKNAFKQWQAASVPVVSVTIAGTTHLDYSLGPTLPASSWCPNTDNNRCEGGWARPMITEYTVAWFDRWLKRRGEPGYAQAEARLLDDARWAQRMSFHFASARDFPLRSGDRESCEDIRLLCGAGE